MQKTDKKELQKREIVQKNEKTAPTCKENTALCMSTLFARQK